MQVELRLFGMPVIEVNRQAVRLENRKSLALLAYLAATRQAHTRERIAALLWPETDQALGALRNALYELQKKTGKQYLDTSRQSIALIVQDGFRADVSDYYALNQASTVPDLLPAERIDLLQRAVSLYQGDFLAGFSLRDSVEFDDWQLTQSAHFQRMQKRACSELIALYEQVGDLDNALLIAEQLRLLDRLAEEPVENLLRLYLAAGKRQDVRRLYEEYATLLEHELGIRPGEACTHYYELTLETRMAARPRPVTGPLVAGSISAAIYHAAEMIPGRPRGFFGRDELIAQALALLIGEERVLLTGMGGIGKTTTAAYVAAAFLEQTQKPVIWLETGFQQATELLLALARAFDQQQAMLTSSDPAGFVMQLIAEKCGLLVLDNCWNSTALFELMQIVPFTMPVLLTSRQRIPIDGEVIAVTPLDDRQARDLLKYHARRVLVDDAELSSLLRLLGRHPYALEIAGKQLKAQPGLTVKDLLKRYRQGVGAIAVPGGYSAENRQTIEHIIIASIETLTPETVQMLTVLGAFAVPRVTEELLALVMGTNPEQMQIAIAELEQSSLLEVRHPDRSSFAVLHLHDLVYSYCRDLFRESGQDRTLLLRGVGEYVRRYSADVRRIDAEFTNIMGALRAARHLDDQPAVVELMRALMVDGYFDARGYTPELLEHLDAAIRYAQEPGTAYRDALHFLHSKRANSFQMQGRLEDAFQEYLEALGTAPDAHRRALIASILGMLAFRLQREEYKLYLDEAEAVSRAHNFPEVLSRLLENRGYIAFSSGDTDAARLNFARAYEAAQETGQSDRIFYTLYNLSVLEMETGNYLAAEPYLSRVHELASESHNDLWMAMYYSSMGRCTHVRGERHTTSDLMTRALEIYERLGDTESAQWVREFLATEQYV